MPVVNNQRGSILVFVTLMIVLLLVLVGIGLDTGQLVYVRNQGQAAVDAAALAAVSGLPSRNANQVVERAKAFNSTNNYVESSTNAIAAANVSYVQYDFTTNDITNYSATVANANGVRVALEQASGGSAITTPVFLTPLMKLLGISGASANKDVNVSAVAVITETPSIPIALWSSSCPATDGAQADNVQILVQHPDQKDSKIENSCWTTYLDCSSSAADVKALFTTTASCSTGSTAGAIGIGTPICQLKGQATTDIKAAQEFFQANSDQEWWLLPVIDGTGNCSEKTSTPIVKWAKIKPTGFQVTKNPKYITASVVCGTNIPHELESSLCFSHRLVRQKVKNM